MGTGAACTGKARSVRIGDKNLRVTCDRRLVPMADHSVVKTTPVPNLTGGRNGNDWKAAAHTSSRYRWDHPRSTCDDYWTRRKNRKRMMSEKLR